ncbi:hypothetical protein EDD37DRAFT_611034 [Exophiala viscosa]|uniref:uncharacterized protein n=1 Tax=Exophiala viscosa TaxID=2486360 RepID=UPI00219E0CDF|nr:hypothetical protein EDD37DRAFT_611034 [Exophiala viscosa]
MATMHQKTNPESLFPSAWATHRKALLTGATLSFVLLQLLFLTNMSLLYGSQFKDAYKTHNLEVLAIDYDGGVVGESMLEAYQQLRASTFVTLDFHRASEYPDYQTVEKAVCSGGAAAASYNSSNTIRYVYNEARYPTTMEGYVNPDLEELVAATRTVYTQINGTRAFSSVNQSDSAAIDAFLNPFTATSINLKPTEQGTRVLYNTASVALSIVQQFFFVMAINGVSSSLNLFSRLTTLMNGLIRHVFATAYTFVGSLCWTGYIWAYKESWALTGGQFMLIWMLGWLFMYINFMLLDTASVLIPMQYMPFFVLTWIIMNITSSLANFDLAPSFYKYGYALPAHNWYETFIQITSGGCYNRLYRTLPVLFAWFIVGHLLVILATNHRCRRARAEGEKQEEERLRSPDEKGASKDEGSSHGADGSLSASASSPTADFLSLSRTRSSTSVYGPSMPPAFEALSRRLTEGR